MELISSDSTWVDLGTAIAPIFVAIFVAYIAFMQWRTADQKVRLDLYDRRFKIYDATVNFYNALSGDVKVVEFLNARAEFFRAVRESQFLFSRESKIYDMLLDLREKAFAIHGFKAHGDALQIDPLLWIDLHKKMLAELSTWDASIKSIEEAMEPYLNFHG